MAPEIVAEPPQEQSGKVDSWSLGVSLFVMLCGRVPFPEPPVSGGTYEDVATKKRGLCQAYQRGPPRPSMLSLEAFEAITSLLQFHPEDRLDCADFETSALFAKHRAYVVSRLPQELSRGPVPTLGHSVSLSQLSSENPSRFRRRGSEQEDTSLSTPRQDSEVTRHSSAPALQAEVSGSGPCVHVAPLATITEVPTNRLDLDRPRQYLGPISARGDRRAVHVQPVSARGTGDIYRTEMVRSPVRTVDAHGEVKQRFASISTGPPSTGSSVESSMDVGAGDVYVDDGVRRLQLTRPRAGPIIPARDRPDRGYGWQSPQRRMGPPIEGCYPRPQLATPSGTPLGATRRVSVPDRGTQNVYPDKPMVVVCTPTVRHGPRTVAEARQTLPLHQNRSISVHPRFQQGFYRV